MNTSPSIQSIEAVLVDLPTIRAHKLAMTTMMRQTLVIVQLICSDGLTGIGEATTIGGLAYGDQSPESIKSAIDNYLAPLLIGTDATSVNVAMQRVSASVQGNSFAKSAVEIALLDAQGQRLGLPVHALLGGAMRDALPVLWTLASGDATRDVDEALALIEARRHKVFKLKIGSHALADDIAHVQAIRRGLGDDVMLTVDVNQAWDETTAVQGIAALEAIGVSLIEQPVARRNRRALKRLAARFDVAIMADEAVHDATDAFDLAADAAADVYALKISQAGGLWPTLRAASVADASGVGVYGGTLLEGSIGSIAAAHVFAACPTLAWGTELFGPLLLKDDIVVQRPDYRDFELQLPHVPGLGVQLDLDKLAFYRRDRASQAVAVTA
ncbi:muconate/chloromuconate family cycloisomerase [Variovorax sp. J22P240]|uniref:muconate/chloromuconate family cycloisomerase n=1 Tax=Variovorax sp. J22P240 TaxID=3053514 RepID=UPI0025776892|nr:muconate/chloromuconate family cycloisomerase [Variovorax sp. J22P240]MDM0002307.1 muconate/chloromuconate family cycloisomerase [Variovorax sp. J22P240]